MIGFYSFKVVEWLLFRLPFSWRRSLFMMMADCAYRFDIKHKRVIRQNVTFAFEGTLDEERIAAISQGCYRNLARNMLQVMENTHANVAHIDTTVTLHNKAVFDRAVASGRGVIFVTAHYGNWELEGAVISSKVTAASSVYKALKNRYFDRYLLHSRERFGMRLFEKHGAIRHLNKAVKNRESISLMIDQNVKEKDGIVVTFFGKKVRQTPAPAFLARKYNAVIIPLLIHPDAEGDVITFYEPIEVAHSSDAQADIYEATQAQASWLEAEIRRVPEHWFWCHRRWKAEYPNIYTT